ncbi:hypothetical protein E4U55_006345 [Claviceps digitariae]|nr:hypothetical protein E4U55_006345 [Claviceps digitariae]
MEPMFTSQQGDGYFPEKALEDYSLWQLADPWFNHAQSCSPAFSQPLTDEYNPCPIQETIIPWMYVSNPETPTFTSPITEQPPTYRPIPIPDRPKQALVRPRRTQSMKKKKREHKKKQQPIVKDEVLDDPLIKRLRTHRSKSLSLSDKSSSGEDSYIKDKDGAHQEKSRMASNKFRARKRSEIAQLESEEYSIEDANRTLRSVLDALTSEILSLKMQILQHNNCNCELIQEYISKEAVNFVQKLETMSS